MKNVSLVFSGLFFVLFFGITVSSAQKINDVKTQKEVFGSQPVWEELNSSDSYIVLTMSEEFGCSKGDKIILWNAVDHGFAQVQAFNPEDSIKIVTKNNVRYYYKYGCKNRNRFIRIETPKTGKVTTPTVTFADPCKPKNPCDDSPTCDQLVVATWALGAGKGTFTDVCGFVHVAKTWKIEYYENRVPSGSITDVCGMQYFINPDVPHCPCDRWFTGKYNY